MVIILPTIPALIGSAPPVVRHPNHFVLPTPKGLTASTSISASTRANFTVIRAITPQIAVLSNNPDDLRLFFTKLYAPNSAAPRLMENETNAYKAYTTLQGREIPHFYGIWRLIDPLNLFILVLTEYIGPSITIENPRDMIKLTQPHERGKAINRLRSLRPSEEEALRALHQSAVCHSDACSRNMVLSVDRNGDETVVILDLDMAKGFSDLEKRRKKE